uniref:G-protein coupled receptors family 1 profile domain-containing protein n=1 Tax=Pelodiscus sinensis TaxID=13735 RepID=K7FHA4_PELSI
ISGEGRCNSSVCYVAADTSMVDMGLTSITLPHALVQAQTHHWTVPFNSCMAQVFLYLAVGTMELYLLAVTQSLCLKMVVNPLRYAAVVTQRSLCLKMAAASLALVISHAILHTVMAAQLRYCGNRLQHFFCNLQILLRLSCTRPIVHELVVFTEGVLVVLAPCAFILASYVRIGVAVSRLRSAQALRKALSTCGSHLTVVTLFYGTVILPYLRPNSSNAQEHDRVAAIFYTAVAPALNPLIYSLRNKDVAAALTRSMAMFNQPEGQGSS